MTVPTVPVVPPVPIRGEAANETAFRTAVETFLAFLAPFSIALNALVTAFNSAISIFNEQAEQVSNDAATTSAIYELLVAEALTGLSGGSSTAITIGLGSKTFNASTGKQWAPYRTTLFIRSSASSSNYMVGLVTNYDPANGALTVLVDTSRGSGSFSDWLIYPGSPKAYPAPKVVYAAKTDTTSTTATTWVDSGLELTITLDDPTRRVMLNVQAVVAGSTVGTIGRFRLTRAGNPVMQGDAAGARSRAHFTYAGNATATASAQAVDTPGTTGPHVYKLQWQTNGSGTLYLNRDGNDSDAATTFRFASTLTAEEISG